MTILEMILTTLSSLLVVTNIGGYFYIKRERKANVVSAEADTTKKIIDLMQEASDLSTGRLKELIGELINDNKLLKQSNDEIRKELRSLNRAIRAINLCNYRAQCPVLEQLPRPTDPA